MNIRNALRTLALAIVTFVVLGPAHVLASPAETPEMAPHAEASHHAGYGDIDWITPVFGHDGKLGLVWILVNFAVLMWLLEKLLFSKLRASTKRKHDEAAEALDHATAAREQAEAKLAEYEGRLSGLEKEIDGLVADAKERAEADRKRIVADAEREAEQIKQAARAAAERDAESRRRELEAEVVDRAIARAEAIIRQRIGAADQRKMADDFVARLDQVNFGG